MANIVDYNKQISAPMVMLAKDYAPELVEYPVIIQPKLDGVRGLISPTGKVYYGRSGAEIPTLLGKFGAYGMWIDGEIYKHGLPLATIGGALRLQEPNEITESLEFHAFDLISTLPQMDRQFVLHTMSAPKLRKVNMDICVSPMEANELYSLLKYEGLIYRNPYVSYIHGRTNMMLKRKRMCTEEYKCVGVNEGLGKFYGTLGAFVCVLEDNHTTFNVSAAELTDEERDAMWKSPPFGALLTIRFPSKSKFNIPLQAQFVAVRNPNDLERH